MFTVTWRHTADCTDRIIANYKIPTMVIVPVIMHFIVICTLFWNRIQSSAEDAMVFCKNWLITAVLFQFVAHPNVQQLLAAIWYEGLPGFRRKNMIQQLIDVSKLGAMFPVYSSIYMLAPKSKMGLFMKKPFVKFICHSSSYAFFLSKSDLDNKKQINIIRVLATV